MSRRASAIVLLITLLGLGLRLLLWRWREFQPLGGDEQEYLDAALTLLRDRRYQELLFMRPPLYPLFLAASIYLVDSLVQNLRLVQALVSAATIPIIALLTQEVARLEGHPRPARPALLGALLCALSYTLAANAAELLTETVFLFGLTFALWAALRAGATGSLLHAALAGLALGALCLVRSVALPLLPLVALWLFLSAKRKAQSAKRSINAPLVFSLCVLLVLLPWTARNYLTYGGLILIDTTGAENLWLDNDPAGREAVKAQLFALGDDRLARQQLGSRNGLAAILAGPGAFAAKAWGELQKFFALELADDMRARPAIWVRPADIWLRLILGDALWLLLLLAGSYGLARFACRLASSRPRALSPAWLLAPWALYVLLTTLIFHVELRYRLPLFPALIPYAALVLTGRWAIVHRPERFVLPHPPFVFRPSSFVPFAVPLICLALTLLHVNYVALGWQLGRKHWQLGAAEAALARGDGPGAAAAAGAALALDERSALARIALARVDLLAGNAEAARAQLDAAVGSIPDHPQAHVLRGDLLRAGGDAAAAIPDLAFERASQQDLQRWAWERSVTPPLARLDLGGGLDLGFLRGFHSLDPADEGFRWTTGVAELRLAPPPGARELVLRVASGRPPGTPPAPLELLVNGEPAGTFGVGAVWQELSVPIEDSGQELVVTLRAPTFTPRDHEPASPDGRRLGVQIDWIEAR